MARCVLRFDNCTAGAFGRGVGLADATSRLFCMHALAAVWGCATVLPPPRHMLSPAHNRGRLAPAAWTWSSYYDVAASWTDVLSEFSAPSPTAVTTTAPTIAELSAVARDGGVLDVRWPAGPMPNVDEVRAAGPRQDLAPKPLREWSPPSPEHCKRFDPAKWGLHLSRVVVAAVDKAQLDLFNSSFVAMHVRRGDKIAALGPAWANQTSVREVAAIAHALRQGARPSVAGSVDAVFLATDETNAVYIGALRYALRQIFAHVVFEWELVRCCMPDATHAFDNSFVFLVAMTLLTRAARFLELAPFWCSKVGFFGCVALESDNRCLS